jgi:hypothetical protein
MKNDSFFPFFSFDEKNETKSTTGLPGLFAPLESKIGIYYQTE